MQWYPHFLSLCGEKRAVIPIIFTAGLSQHCQSQVEVEKSWQNGSAELPNADCEARGEQMDGRRSGLQEYGSDADATVGILVPLPARHLSNLLGVPVKNQPPIFLIENMSLYAFTTVVGCVLIEWIGNLT